MLWTIAFLWYILFASCNAQFKSSDEAVLAAKKYVDQWTEFWNGDR